MRVLIRTGGLFRCCVETAETKVYETAPKEGEVLVCKYCHKLTMIYRAGAWEWWRN